MQRFRRASLVLATLALAACAKTVVLSERMPESAALAEGEGWVIGSIEVITPAEAAEGEQREGVEALRERELEVTIRRYVMRLSDVEGGIGWRDHVGDEYVVSLRTDAEQRIVLRAPAGKYAIVELHDFHSELFGDQPGCKTTGLADFEVHAGETTYIGKLVVRVGFRPEEEIRRAKIFERADRIWAPGLAERWLHMGLSAEDARDATLRALAADSGSVPGAVRTELMDVGIGDWRYEPPKPPPVPGTP